MAQPLLKRRLNPLLLISTVAALSLLAGVAVVSQDQISEKQDVVSTLRDNNTRLATEINRQDARISNLSIKLRQYEGDLGELRAEKQNLSDTVDEKNDRINTLESQLSEAEQTSDQSELVQDLNSSLAAICTQASPSNIEINTCDDHGHTLGGTS